MFSIPMSRPNSSSASPGASLPKAYDASSVEDEIYANWEASGAFNPDELPARNQNGDPYCIVMPPPNRTGTLHMGHAAMLAIEDLLIRFHRMRGKRALWIPGTDHAAIATQVKVEQKLIAEGMVNPREELGREAFLERVVDFAEESRTTINRQVRKMGSSCDWSREKYTLDHERNRAVNEMFRMMYEDGIIERGYRIVNWDPQFQTTLSDDEVEYREGKAQFVTFKYDEAFPFPISTTRPETKFGDTAVAVHPDDPRYKPYIGQTFEPVFCGKKITVTVIADAAVDPAFGTGALGVTPAHSMVDADMAVRHGLQTIVVIGKDARMTAEAGERYADLTIPDARRKILAELEDKGLIEKVEEIPQNLPVAQRGGAPVEQIPMEQWFIRVNKPFALRQDTLGKWRKGEEATLKELMRHAVVSGQINIYPDRFTKTYFHWIDHLRDWCISRQIWFGHRIPVWYKGTEMAVSSESPGRGWTQDPDTLDTWFSSGLWTFSTLGWPERTHDLEAFHPTAVLETGYDILFFWVARMVLMTTYALGDVPFHDVYLHGLIRDEEGRKMSKSLGNVLDPLDLIPKYGTDAVRLSLVLGTSPGQDVNLSEDKIKGFRNFTNKLWNISRFILMQIGDPSIERRASSVAERTLADDWILTRLTDVIVSVTAKLEKYELSSAGEELRDFTWGDLADWYLEVAKIEGEKQAVLTRILRSILKLWHPFMPFVTEHVWKTAGFDGSLITAEWPEHLVDPRAKGSMERGTQFERIRLVVTDARRLRAEQGIEAARMAAFSISGALEMLDLLKENEAVLKQLIRASDIRFGQEADPSWASTVSGTVTIALNVAGSIDVKQELQKAKKELKETEGYIKGLERQLANNEFISKAPSHVVEGLEVKRQEAEQKRAALQETVKRLS